MLEVFADGPFYYACGQRYSQSWCWCKCGNPEPVLVRNCYLLSGHTKSCSCRRGDSNRSRTVHGHARRGAKDPTYQSWADMTKRCGNPNANQYDDYGGRGLRICAGLKPFPGFLSVLGLCPPGLEIDRPNNEGHYSCGKCAECLQRGWPLNVRWATIKQQMRNTRRTRFLTYKGETKCLAEWAEQVGLKGSTISRRLKRGWTLERALTEP